MRLVASITLVVCGLAILTAQPQQPIRVGANFVRVDAYPTKDGRIVEGLVAADFAVLEDGVPQKIDTFEHVVVSRGPQSARTEPSSQRDMVRALSNPRARVFLIFLDGPYVTLESSHAINEPLIRFMTNVLADDDLVAVMTPGMSASQIVFGRKTTVIEDGLRRNWNWGRQGRPLDPELDRQQIQYEMCFPGAPDVGRAMAVRSRERATLEALQDAVRYLSSVREERKAFVAVTQGWVLFREDPSLMRQRETEPPIGIDKVRPGPTGQLTIEDKRNQINMLGVAQCDADRERLALIDNEKFLREIIDDANRGNASFYMIDPSGLTVRGADRSTAMRTLADNTDGFAALNSNDLNRGFERIEADMSSYYLLGYNASNTKLDGRFREISVRVRQPGVVVRARKGYRAPTASEVAEARNRPGPVPVAPGVTSVQAALDRLGRIRPTARFRVDAIAGPGPMRSVWVVGELRSETSRPDEFAQGATAAVQAIAGTASSSATVVLKPGQRVFVTRLDMPTGASGSLDIRVRLTPDDSASQALSEGARLDLNATEPKPLMFRRGPTTGPQLSPAADPVFSRTERVRLEIPAGPGPRDGKAGSGRLLDRGGLATQIPVVVAERTDAVSGQRWITADLSLAALSPGDYVVEVAIVKESGEERVLTPIRVGR